MTQTGYSLQDIQDNKSGLEWPIRKCEWEAFCFIVDPMTLPEEFITENLNNLNWTKISLNEHLMSVEFIRKYKDKLNWNSMDFRRSSRPLEFFEEFRDYLGHGFIGNIRRCYFEIPNCTDELADFLITKHIDTCNKEYWKNLSTHERRLQQYERALICYHTKDSFGEWVTNHSNDIEKAEIMYGTNNKK